MSDSGVIDPIYLPFSAEQLRRHLAPAGGATSDESVDRKLQYYLDSAGRYREFKDKHPVLQGLSLEKQRKPRQIEKDERFWIAGCLMRYFYAPDRKKHLGTLLQKCFGESPPLADIGSWHECLDDGLRLFFEVRLPSPRCYKQWLAEHLDEHQFVPYVLDAAHRVSTGTVRAGLEGPSRIDAMLLNVNTGFAVLFEAKVLSDISVQVTYDARRNQLARTIDVMLEENDNLAEPLSLRRPEDSLFALITPEVFHTNPSSRLYGWLLNEYCTNPEALARDLPHRDLVDWPALARRIGGLTWEDCARIFPGSCPWLETGARGRQFD